MERGAGGSKRGPEAGGMTTDSFDYYMIRVLRSSGGPAQVSGQVERLGTGEKHGFHSGQDLARLIASWPDQPSRLQPEDSSPTVDMDPRR